MSCVTNPKQCFSYELKSSNERRVSHRDHPWDTDDT